MENRGQTTIFVLFSLNKAVVCPGFSRFEFVLIGRDEAAGDWVFRDWALSGGAVVRALLIIHPAIKFVTPAKAGVHAGTGFPPTRE